MAKENLQELEIPLLPDDGFGNDCVIEVHKEHLLGAQEAREIFQKVVSYWLNRYGLPYDKNLIELTAHFVPDSYYLTGSDLQKIIGQVGGDPAARLANALIDEAIVRAQQTDKSPMPFLRHEITRLDERALQIYTTAFSMLGAALDKYKSLSDDAYLAYFSSEIYSDDIFSEDELRDYKAPWALTRPVNACANLKVGLTMFFCTGIPLFAFIAYFASNSCIPSSKVVEVEATRGSNGFVNVPPEPAHNTTGCPSTRYPTAMPTDYSYSEEYGYNTISGECCGLNPLWLALLLVTPLSYIFLCICCVEVERKSTSKSSAKNTLISAYDSALNKPEELGKHWQTAISLKKVGLWATKLHEKEAMGEALSLEDSEQERGSLSA